MKINKLFASSILMLFTTSAFAASGGAESTEIEIMKKLQDTYPSTHFTDVRKSGLDGLYEVAMGKNIGYTNAEGRYFMFGHIFDMKTQQDLTQQRLDELNVVDFSQLPLNDAIKTVHGNGRRKIAVFSDPDCPYCKRLEAELPKLDNVTIYTFLYPLDGLHPNSSKTAKSIWCSANAQTAWSNYMTSNKQPVDKTDCANPIERNVQLGQKLNINGTPTLIAADGRVLPGAAPIEQLNQWIEKGGK